MLRWVSSTAGEGRLGEARGRLMQAVKVLSSQQADVHYWKVLDMSPGGGYEGGRESGHWGRASHFLCHMVNRNRWQTILHFRFRISSSVVLREVGGWVGG